MNKLNFVGLGELLWDLLPSGKQLGGASANFAYHANSLGQNGVLVSSIGCDLLGIEIKKALKALNLSDDYVSTHKTYPTGTVKVSIDKNGQPSYQIVENVAWDFIPYTSAIKKLAYSADVVCFGSLSQRSASSRKTIASFLGDTQKDCLKIYDINIRQGWYSKDLIYNSLLEANFLKLNEDELPLLSEMFNLSGEPEKLLQSIMTKFDLSYIVFTRGALGSVIMSRNKYCEHPGFTVNIKDTVGAGDAFTATVAVGLKKQYSLSKINENANKIASFVCSQEGGTPKYPREIL